MNKHIHPTIAAALNPFFSVGIKTRTRELGCCLQAPDSHTAMVVALTRAHIPEADTPTSGLELSVKVVTQ